jgi:hypothetical protein
MMNWIFTVLLKRIKGGVWAGIASGPGSPEPVKMWKVLRLPAFGGRRIVRMPVLFLPRTKIFQGREDHAVKDFPAHHQKKFDYFFLKSQTGKIQCE